MKNKKGKVLTAGASDHEIAQARILEHRNGTDLSAEAIGNEGGTS